MGGAGSGRRGSAYAQKSAGAFANYKSRRSIAVKATGRKIPGRGAARLMAAMSKKRYF